jgi:hypothetical protein
MSATTTTTIPLVSQRRSRWPWVFGLLALLAFGAAMLGWGMVEAVNPMPVTVTIDGERVINDLDLASMPPAHKVVLAAVVACALLLAIVLVPVALVLSLGLLLLIVLLAVGLPLFVAGAVLALVLSPLILAGWLLVSLLS